MLFRTRTSRVLMLALCWGSGCTEPSQNDDPPRAAAEPVGQKAVAPNEAVTAFATAICACDTQGCADAQLASNRAVLETASTAAMSAAAADEVMAARQQVTHCLADLGYVGTSVPALADTADRMADSACACADEGCFEDGLTIGMFVFAEALTPDDMQIIDEAMERASTCGIKIASADSHLRNAKI